ncbi:mobile mystery protein A [Flavobacterium sp. SM2513]|uniref:mobile mystery protein A n=1 Tax=Flavobacterium sp. SM2513 TaxID=3424766 RepID=UPI003D7FC0E6
MMRSTKKLLIDQLDKKLKPFQGTEKVIVPQQGWVHTIRTSLNMTLNQLGEKLQMTKQGIKKIEEREATESISIKSLKEIGKALDMHFVYGFVPKYNSVDEMISAKATKIAQRIVLRTNQNMKLENQGNSPEQINNAIMELANELKREMHKSLWD